MNRIESLLSLIRTHRCYSHPVFEHWADTDPEPNVVGALFHQIQSFCASTRPGGAFVDALDAHGMPEQSRLLQEIVASEANHGPELATMAAFIVNRRAKEPVFPDLGDVEGIEDGLRGLSDELLARLPGYDSDSGLLPQTRSAIGVMARREARDRETTLKNLGTTLALEVISNQHLIPGEKNCLIDAGLYGVELDAEPMHYLLEHWGECGAEEQHEQHAFDAIESVLDDRTEPWIRQGAVDFLDALAALWDVLDASLLQSGQPVRQRRSSSIGSASAAELSNQASA